jgi:hypothetical protein
MLLNIQRRPFATQRRPYTGICRRHSIKTFKFMVIVGEKMLFAQRQCSYRDPSPRNLWGGYWKSVRRVNKPDRKYKWEKRKINKKRFDGGNRWDFVKKCLFYYTTRLWGSTQLACLKRVRGTGPVSFFVECTTGLHIFVILLFSKSCSL